MNTEKSQSRRVNRAIKLALAPIAEKNPELTRLLERTIKTGTYLTYSPACGPSPRRNHRAQRRRNCRARVRLGTEPNPHC
jgi:hypothetical protein